MSDFEGEVEFLDEDADIVQQCIQIHQVAPVRVESPTDELLIVKPSKTKKKKVVVSEDSDYDPREEYRQSLRKVAKTYKSNQKTPKRLHKEDENKKTPLDTLGLQGEYEKLKKLHLNIPDYDDPIFLPGKSTASDADSLQTLKNWNSMVLFSSEKSDYSFMPQKGTAVSSKRITMFKNNINKETGLKELNLWNRVTVTNKDNESRTEVLQCIVPKFTGTESIEFNMLPAVRKKKTPLVNEVVLTKEDINGEDRLVVYKPQDAISTVYKLVEKGGVNAAGEVQPGSRHIERTASCRMCAACHHMSYRSQKTNKENKRLQCPACLRTMVSAHSLLSHVRTHRDLDVRIYRHAISKILSRVVEHQYVCRLCGWRAHTVTQLRAHLATLHRGSEIFNCEVCNRVTR